MTEHDISPNLTFSRHFEVTESWSAQTMHTGGVPVLSTAALIQAVETLAFESLSTHLKDGYTTVGTKVDITHLYPTAIGQEFRVELFTVKADPKKVEFSVTVRHGGQVIASGVHRRHIVRIDRFMKRLAEPKN